MLGWIPDEPDSSDVSASALLGATTRMLPREGRGLRTLLDGPNDQVGNSCVGHAYERAIEARLRYLGYSFPKRSAQAIYTGARRYDSEEKLVDEGSQPRKASSFINNIGIPAESSWPSDGSKLNEELEGAILQEASTFLVFDTYKVFAKGASRADQVAHALSKQYPVVFGSVLDQAFFDYKGGKLPPYGPETKGGHMLCLLEYWYDERGQRIFLGINSWGLGWGESGFFLMGDDRLASDRVGDVTVIVLSP